MEFSHRTRSENLQKLRSQKFDLVIVGGGISGAGAARDAVSRGMTVALVEANDFASGTSSRSSKLIHGGIRYLENLEFGLVFEALTERRNLFEMAPHLVHPLRFLLPLYKGGRVGMFKLGLGMWLYDALSTFEAPQMHERLSKTQTLDRMPILEGDKLAGSYVYSDAYMDDDRLVIETLRSAHNQGAVSVNFCSAIGGEMQNEKLHKIKVRDEISKEEFFIEGRHFISTVGPWTDIVAPKLLGEWKKKMRPSKGIHLTFDRKRIPLKSAVVMISDDEKRIVFGIPRHEMIIIGTTDTDYSGDPRDVHTTKADVEYLLRIVGQYFPNAKLTEKDILASYAGVRPLVHDGSQSESKTSREHLILTDPRNITFVMGGKYTTYRLISEEAIEAALKAFSFEEQVAWSKPNTTGPLNPLVTRERLLRAGQLAASAAKEHGLDVDTVNFLIDRHGEEAFEILENHGYLGRRAGKEGSRWLIEAGHAIENTMCLNLLDFYLRRSPLFLARADHGLMLLGSISDLFQKAFGWSEAEKKQQVNALHAHIQSELGWR
jgi:glycerol-3-phosphate dehydrogenase